MSSSEEGRHHITAVPRDGERVTPLELFFDLVFVLAITQCTALMAHEQTWHGIAQGILVLGILWWAWVGYAWLTSVIEPEEGAVRLVMFEAMAAMLVVTLCVPEAFDHLGLTFAIAYGFVRTAHIALFVLASQGDVGLRRSVVGLAFSTAIGVMLLVVASFTTGVVQGGLWAAALVLDAAGPFVFGSEGWHLVPGHFAERHGLVVLIALGESIVAIGVGAEVGVDGGVIAAAVVGMAVAAALWWLYFDVVALAAEHRLGRAEVGREQNEIARDSYSYLHFPMVAGIVLLALGLKVTILHVGEDLDLVPAFALVGGVALYLLAHVAFRLRNMHSVNVGRLVLAVVLFAAVPVATRVPALATTTAVAVLLWSLIVYEAVHFSEMRSLIRRTLSSEPEPE